MTRDKTAETTSKMFKRYITSYDCPRLVVTDCGPAFSSAFLDFLSAHYIDHHYSSHYRPMSNSPAERSVRSIKDVLRKIPNFTEKTLRTVVFGINQHQAQDSFGSPSERLFKRHIRSGLPSIIKKELQHEDLMKIRAEKQQKAAKKKGKLSADTFELEDEVWIQNAAN